MLAISVQENARKYVSVYLSLRIACLWRFIRLNLGFTSSEREVLFSHFHVLGELSPPLYLRFCFRTEKDNATLQSAEE